MTQAKDPPGTLKECRSCGASIVWTITSRGKSMPCDMPAAPDGEFYLFKRPDKIDAVHKASDDARVAQAKSRNQNLYTSHFATCPQAAQHRNRKVKHG